MNKWIKGKFIHFAILQTPWLVPSLQTELRLPFPQCDTSLSQYPSTTVCLLVIEVLGLFRREITAMPVFCTHCDHLQINLDGNIIFLLYGAQF